MTHDRARARDKVAVVPALLAPLELAAGSGT